MWSRTCQKIYIINGPKTRKIISIVVQRPKDLHVSDQCFRSQKNYFQLIWPWRQKVISSVVQIPEKIIFDLISGPKTRKIISTVVQKTYLISGLEARKIIFNVA